MMQFMAAYEALPDLPGIEDRYHAVFSACDIAKLRDDRVSIVVTDDMRRERSAARMVA
jgi:hypothetical protein